MSLEQAAIALVGLGARGGDIVRRLAQADVKVRRKKGKMNET